MSTPAPRAVVAELNEKIGKPTVTLIDAARRLVDVRAKAENASLLLHAKLAEFNERYAWLAEDKKTADAAVAEAEADVKALARAHFDATGEKKPVVGIEIKVYDVLKYDSAQAFAWAQNKGMALIPECLDVKAFEKIAKATALPFVTLGQDPRVQIGKVIEVPPLSFADVNLDVLFGGAP